MRIFRFVRQNSFYLCWLIKVQNFEVRDTIADEQRIKKPTP